ncbi:MAG: hypothetical protein M1826_006201 [Phylliscum demangeonii]|nr:MAG: hypothetical protein M1826_006201 [Phylliscum demangeonii]
MSFPVQKTDDEWGKILPKKIGGITQVGVMRRKHTEHAFTGEYDEHWPKDGVYHCAGCDAPLYEAKTKYKSGSGWPSFYDALPDAVTRHTDYSHGMKRVEIVCSRCGGHLGHVFDKQDNTNPTKDRHCVNSLSLNFAKKDHPTEPTGADAKVEK